MTQTRAGELTAELAAKRTLREKEAKTLADRLKNIEALRGYIDHLDNQIVKLEAQLAREDTVLIRPEGKCVTLEDSTGVAWKV